MRTNILCIFLFLFIGCGKKDNSNTYDGPQIPFLKTTWIFTSLKNNKTSSIIPYPDNIAKKEVIIFDSLNILSVGGTCNGCQFKYAIGSNDSIALVGNGICTLIQCENINWEDSLMRNLGGAYAYKIYGNNLVIYTKGINNLNFVSASN
jgi:hypothetical protein